MPKLVRLIGLLFVVVSMSSPVILAQQNAEFSMMEIEQATLELLKGTDKVEVKEFVAKYRSMNSNLSEDAFQQRVSQVRTTLRPYLGGVGISGSPEGLTFEFSSDKGSKNLVVLIDGKGILNMEVIEPKPLPVITEENIHSVMDDLEAQGVSGLLFARKKGEEIIARPFGYANASLGIKNNRNTIFGTGSRPIDYTVAAILLLDQQGKLNVEDPITSFYENIPDDKKSMTVQHLMTGRSGLPDFFDIESDWDADLAWIDRETAEQRLLNIPLIFEPGTSREHSHAAFGLLAAIIERVSGMSYYAFIREHFLDPAGMSRTGEYGEHRGLALEDFAVGGGPEIVGIPNIPPNWGPTSWLIKGSGGMYSTLDDLRKFYDYVLSGKVLDKEHQRRFLGESIQLDGSMRGFELFSVHAPQKDTELYLFLNNIVDMDMMRDYMRALEKMVMSDGE